MLSALEIVAFANNNRPEGIIALLEVALKALDDEGHAIAAIHVDTALAMLKLDKADREVESIAASVRARTKEVVH